MHVHQEVYIFTAMALVLNTVKGNDGLQWSHVMMEGARIAFIEKCEFRNFVKDTVGIVVTWHGATVSPLRYDIQCNRWASNIFATDVIMTEAICNLAKLLFHFCLTLCPCYFICIICCPLFVLFAVPNLNVYPRIASVN